MMDAAQDSDGFPAGVRARALQNPLPALRVPLQEDEEGGFTEEEEEDYDDDLPLTGVAVMDRW